MSDLQEFFRKNGLKITPQRVFIYETIASMKTHPYTEEVYKIVKKKRILFIFNIQGTLPGPVQGQSGYIRA